MTIQLSIFQQMTSDLLQLKGIGPINYYKLLNQYGGIEKAHAALRPSKFEINSTMPIECVGHWQKEYPIGLKNLRDPPPLIWCLGDIKLLKLRGIAVVGGRNASLHGRDFTQILAKKLTLAGWNVVSGLARGIDTYAHLGAIDGSTTAVLAGGVDKLYPKENKILYDKMIAKQLVVSESMPGVEPIAQLFPRRNRIIAALTEGLVVIEAAIKSGSLITVKAAIDLNLPIFAVPGHPFDPRVRGCNNLIREGAYLLESIEDIESIMPSPHIVTQPIRPSKLVNLAAIGDIKSIIFNCLSHTPINLDQIFQMLNGVPINLILEQLTMLELEGLIKRVANDQIQLA